MYQRFQRFCLCGQGCVIVTFPRRLMSTSVSLWDMCCLCGGCLEMAGVDEILCLLSVGAQR